MRGWAIGWLASALLLTVTAFGAPAAAEYPDRQVTIIVPIAPGGGTDTQARLLANGLSDELGQPMVIVNRPGANGFVGAQFVSESRPDGYTLMLQSAGSFILAGLMRPQVVDAVEGFTPIAQIGELSTSVMVRADSEYESIHDLLEDAKRREGDMSWSHNGRGSFHHIAGVALSQSEGLQMRDVPFDGGGPSRAALVGGQVDFAMLGIQQLSGFESQLRALAVVAEERDQGFPDVPTLREEGLKAALVSSPTVLYAPLGTPEDVIQTLSTAIETVVTSDAYRAELGKIGLFSSYRGSGETGEYLRVLRDSWQPVVEATKR